MTNHRRKAFYSFQSPFLVDIFVYSFPLMINLNPSLFPYLVLRVPCYGELLVLLLFGQCFLLPVRPLSCIHILVTISSVPRPVISYSLQRRARSMRLGVTSSITKKEVRLDLNPYQ